ncbi:unnamed protein product [Heligmosomoides polygyrus]|uniref:Uncharacterized protein n=1 Tax=Heligmosomoides polygyrus TaxID=6339 RepID=A0A183FG47_HELPZ|nr:unnamed protein product [Heligmosomoides polygyrus]
MAEGTKMVSHGLGSSFLPTFFTRRSNLLCRFESLTSDEFDVDGWAQSSSSCIQKRRRRRDDATHSHDVWPSRARRQLGRTALRPGQLVAFVAGESVLTRLLWDLELKQYG